MYTFWCGPGYGSIAVFKLSVQFFVTAILRYSYSTEQELRSVQDIPNLFNCFVYLYLSFFTRSILATYSSRISCRTVRMIRRKSSKVKSPKSCATREGKRENAPICQLTRWSRGGPASGGNGNSTWTFFCVFLIHEHREEGHQYEEVSLRYHDRFKILIILETNTACLFRLNACR
jgi:hypothetical protein